jgi:hypothetical protein
MSFSHFYHEPPRCCLKCGSIHSEEIDDIEEIEEIEEIEKLQEDSFWDLLDVPVRTIIVFFGITFLLTVGFQ